MCNEMLGCRNSRWSRGVAAVVLVILLDCTSGQGEKNETCKASISASNSDLVHWFKANGGVMNSKVAHSDQLPRGPGLVALEAIEKDEVLLVIPRKVQLTLPRLREAVPMTSDLPESRSLKLFQPHFAILLALAVEARGADDLQFWAPYLNKLAATEHGNMVALLPKLELGLLGKSPVRSRSNIQKTFYREDFKAIAKKVSHKPLGTVNVTDFILAHLAIDSRSFLVGYSNSSDAELTDGGVLAMVPILDDINHAGNTNAIWEVDPQQHVVRVRAAKRIAAGVEITHSYGQYSNPNLLVRYGFTLPPDEEPYQSFHLLCTQAVELGIGSSCPSVDKGLDLFTHDAKPLNTWFRILGKGGLDPWMSLKKVVQHNIAFYERDAMLAPFLENLRSHRALDPSRAVWWNNANKATGEEEEEEEGEEENGEEEEEGEEGEEDEEEDINAPVDDTLPPSASGSLPWNTSVVRAKMSEYMTLLTHRELLLLHEKKLMRKDALPAARKLWADTKKF